MQNPKQTEPEPGKSQSSPGQHQPSEKTGTPQVVPSSPASDIRLRNENTIYLSFSRLTAFPDHLWSEKDRGFPADVLKTIDASCNSITDICPQLQIFSNLAHLNLGMNHISKLSDDIAKFAQLQSLVLQNNQLLELPLSISLLTNLTSVDCAHNILSKLPLEFSSLQRLKSLKLSHNEFKVLPECVTTLIRLTELTIMNNYVETLPYGISELTALERLDVGNNHLVSLPPLSSSLKALLVPANHLTEMPAFCSRLIHLATLDVGYNDLTEQSFHMEYFVNMTQRSINVSGNNMVDFSNALVLNKSIPPSTILPEALFLGNWECSRNKYLLKKLKITHILTVAHDIKPSHPDSFAYLVITIDDMPDVPISDYFDKTNDWIHAALQAKGRVLIHCAAGISRSVTMTVAYLMRYHKYSLQEAMSYVKKQRPIAEPNRGFVRCLEQYQTKLEKDRQACALM